MALALRRACLRQLRAECVLDLRLARTAEAASSLLTAAIGRALPDADVAMKLRNGRLLEQRAASGLTGGVSTAEVERAVTRLVVAGDACAVIGHPARDSSTARNRGGQIVAASLWSEGEQGVLLARRFSGFSVDEVEFVACLADSMSCFLQRISVAHEIARSGPLIAAGGYAALVAHDVAKQLSCLRHHASRARRDCEPGGEVATALDAIVEIGSAATSCLRRFAELGADRPQRGVESFRGVSEIIETAVANVQRARGQIDIRERVSEEARKLVIAEPIGSVLENLLDNAVMAGPEGAPIIVTGDLSEGQLRLAVRDYGLGASAAEHGCREADARLARRREEGLGVGLTLSRELVDFLGGRLDLSSQTGGGTKASILVPIAWSI